ncbi:DUF2380 domain-containing protein [Paracoccus rhizosphaerae]|uniref:DUF2380 domain-containing protein n=1 Tax=Paracoccus rhizosphaerae TaxID=1133347 RepID=A0ABV6CLF3_9RHOB|nr:DUF2380 domain-containing protein [Paracoccus rhizosphaerae]
MRSVQMAALLWLGTLVPATAETLAIFPPKFLDTSHEVRDQSVDHQRRLDLLAETLNDELTPSVVIGRPQIAATCTPETTDCLLSLAHEAQAERSLFVVVQKTSTLIIQIFVTLVHSGTGQLIASPSLNFRGDTDESWHRAARFLARELQDL